MADTTRLHIGTSGWSYKEWLGLIYPEKCRPGDFLSYYIREFGCTEINSSFYHMPLRSTVEKWMANTPEKFLFCAKLYRGITHFRKLVPDPALMEGYCSRFDGYAHRLGPFLIQLPPSLMFNAAVVEKFYALLKQGPAGFRYAIEPRHITWFTDESLLLMSDYDITFTIGDAGKRFPFLETVTNETVYLRMHGREVLYASLYSHEELQEYAEKIMEWLREGLQVYVFFNNTMYGNAIHNARTLEGMLEKMAEK